MPSSAPLDRSNEYWRSLNQLADAPEFRRFLEAEFPAPDDDGGITRRRWLQAIGVSLAAAGVGGCRWEREEIHPFDKRPPGRVPGKPQRFATAMDVRGSAVGLLVTSVDGRPIKVEGNPKHPQSLGGTDALAQAAIFELYDPDRSQSIVRATGSQQISKPWDDFAPLLRAHIDPFRKTGGKGFCILAAASSSPTLGRVRGQFAEAFPEAGWFEYEPVAVAGDPGRVHFDLAAAEVIVSLDADLLSAHPASLEYARRFADARRPDEGRMNRLYVVESCPSCTGVAADHRLALSCGRISAFAAELYRRVAARGTGDAVQVGARRQGDPVQHFVAAAAADLAAHRGRGVVAAGPAQPPAVQMVVRRINAALGNVGKTVHYLAAGQRRRHVEAIRAVVERITAGEVSTLVILGGNPVYNAPADLDFAAALAKVETTVHLGLYRDETGQACEWHVPAAHPLEAWSDARSYDGTYSVVQPLIAPLYGGRTAAELVALFLGDPSPDAEKLVRGTFAQIAGARHSEALWRRTLHDGLLPGTRWPTVEPELPDDLPEVAPPAADELELVFRPDASVYDGRFANNGWLQEMPDPITRLTWGNAAVLSPATAKRLGVEDGTVVKLTCRGRALEIPAYVLPGQADGTVAVSLGYGRVAAGHVGGLPDQGIAPVGADAYRLRTSEAMHFATGVSVEPTGTQVKLATTQDHFAIDPVGQKTRDERARTLVREASLDELKHYQGLSDEDRREVDITGRHGHHLPLVSLWQEAAYPGHRWGMAIDLSKCIGCGACVVACQAENNIPVVGKERVLQGREMHWIRVDRYFRGHQDNPDLVMQPVACQQCELAPCEQVCPVAATVHSKEGLNDMVYNRCIGTRYCANNCPYKVRRFNYFAYHEALEDPGEEVAKMKFNPEVTVRSRGVMEKCTYCVQRIQAAKIDAKNRRAVVADGQIQTACQQACPSQAIRFGDLADAESKVYRAHASARAYTMLAELNVKPRTAYLARIRNPNPQLAGSEHDHETGPRNRAES